MFWQKEKAKIRNTVFNENPFNTGDLLSIYMFSKEGRWIKNSEGEWKKSSTQFENFLTSYEIKNKKS